jgi:predicted PP-loop superfamily ATPase
MKDKTDYNPANPLLPDCDCLFEVVEPGHGGCDREFLSIQNDGETSENFSRSEVNYFRRFLQLSGGSDSPSSSTFISRMPTSSITVDRCVEKIRVRDLNGLNTNVKEKRM